MNKTLFYTIVITFLFSACVSSKKHKDLQNKYDEATSTEEMYERRIEYLKSDNDRLERENRLLKDVNNNQNANKLYRGKDMQNLDEIQRWQEKYLKLEIAYNQLLQNTKAETAKLYQNQTLGNTNLTSSNLPYNSNANNYPTYQAGNLNNTTLNTDATNVLLDNLNTTPLNPVLQQQKNNMQSQVQQALVNLDGRYQEMKNLGGSLEILMLDKGLFEGNTTQVTTNGITTLKNLCAVFKQYPNVKISLLNTDIDFNENLSKSKTNIIGQIMQSENVVFDTSAKSTLPSAFETSGTNAQESKTILVLKFD